jgi:hypothetical protein
MAVESLQVAVKLATHPTVSAMVQIIATLPVTAATGGKSFSALKYMKNYLRSIMIEDFRNGLAHFYINRNDKLEYGKVVELFGTRERR